jgi:hypothetical protein
MPPGISKGTAWADPSFKSVEQLGEISIECGGMNVDLVFFDGKVTKKNKHVPHDLLTGNARFPGFFPHDHEIMRFHPVITSRFHHDHLTEAHAWWREAHAKLFSPATIASSLNPCAQAAPTAASAFSMWKTK